MSTAETTKHLRTASPDGDPMGLGEALTARPLDNLASSQTFKKDLEKMGTGWGLVEG
jgi:hypothetical protein